jgi:pimeloyl-ACP methyl ester carboxylesterase
MGGAVALELALQIPVAGLVLISTGARLKVRKEILEAAAAAVEPQSFGALLCQTESSRKHVERIEHEIPPATLLSDWQAVHAFDRMEEIKRINVPTLVMVGTEDPLTPPKYARYLADAIPTARLQLIPEAGHMLPFDRPELLLNALSG